MILYSKTYLNPNHKEWVVFVHGAGGSNNVWYKQVKEFKKHFNVVLLDLRGHGNSNQYENIKRYSFQLIIEDIIQLLNHHKIKKAHFIGISLGSMLSKYIAIEYPKRVKSLILGGSIIRLNLKSRVLLNIGNTFKKIVPYMWLYRIFASIILPKKNHAQSRKLFIKEAMRMDQKEFLKWFGLTKELPKMLETVRNAILSVPVLFIQGQEDHMFLKDLIKSTKKSKSLLKIIPSCGHVVNVESPITFNLWSISFLKDLRQTI